MSKRLPLPTLLIAADNPSIRFWIKKHLHDQFFILDAEKKEEALSCVQNGEIDFIIIDASFEDCDALALCRELKKSPTNRLTPALLITGRLKKSFRDAALDAGVTDFISDQMDPEELETRIAIGLKTTSTRQKTAQASNAMQLPKRELSNAYLKKKFLLNDQTAQVLADAKRENHPLSLLFLRIDAPSNELLLPFSEFVSHLLLESDFLIPSLGGNFIVLLPHKKWNEAKKMAQFLQKEVRNHPFETKQGSPLFLTVSIGYTQIGPTEPAFNTAVATCLKTLSESQNQTNLLIPIDPVIL